MSMSALPRQKKRQMLSTRGILVVLVVFAAMSSSIGYWKLSSESIMSITLSDARFTSHQAMMAACPPLLPPPPSQGSSSSSRMTTTDFEFLCQDPAVSFLQISPPTTTTTTVHDEQHRRRRRRPPRILCVVLTQSNNHATRMKAVVDTWGRKCDTLIAASNETDPAVHAHRIESTYLGYWGIWDKLMQTLRLIVDGDNRNTTTGNSLFPIQDDSYDWILKADDDTYVIMENLRAFLANVTHPSSNNDEPRIYGRTMAWPRLTRFRDMRGWFDNKSPPFTNKEFGKRFYSKLGDSQTLRFSHGGPGYIMNRNYARMLVQAYFNKTSDGSYNAIKGEVAEDIANAATMLYHGIRPESTVDMDAEGRERMHPESPQTMYANPIWLERMHHGMKLSVRGDGEQCCSPRSISFHYVADFQMRLLDYQLYQCPRKEIGS